jgi:hypothetical protein
MRFTQVANGYIRAYSHAGDRVEVRKTGSLWTLTVSEAETWRVMHTATAPKAYLCCQEACRFFGVGAYGQVDK